MKKKLLTLGLVAALSATAAIGGTLAYFTDTKEAVNTFTVGNVKIEINEPNWAGVPGTSKEEGTPIEDVYPGQHLAKDPEVKNVGKNSCFVRVSVSNLDQYVEKYGPSAMIIYMSNSEENKLGSEYWVDGKDGYFYWTKVMEKDDTTASLFEKIIIPTNLTNDDTAQEIGVYAEAVQSQGFPGEVADDGVVKIDALKDWFATCGIAAN